MNHALSIYLLAIYLLAIYPLAIYHLFLIEITADPLNITIIRIIHIHTIRIKKRGLWHDVQTYV